MATSRQRRSRPLTARPKHEDDLPHASRSREHGLSIDPEELGSHFLNEATEQGNFDPRGDDDDRAIVEEPPSDEPFSGPGYEPGADIWENTVRSVIDHGMAGKARPLIESDVVESSAEADSHDVDLTQPAIREASLFDEEGKMLGEVKRAHPRVSNDGARAARIARRDGH